MGRALLILDGRLPLEGVGDCEQMDLQAFVQRAYDGHWWRRVNGFDSVRLLTQYTDCLPRRWFLQVLLWLLARRVCEIEGADGRATRVTWRTLLRGAGTMACDALGQYVLYRRTWRQLVALELGCARREGLRAPAPEGGVLYLKTDLWLGVPAGGSVTHMAGVANELAAMGMAIRAWAPTPNPLLAPRVIFESLSPPARFWDFRESPVLAFNALVLNRVKREITAAPPAWIYQRYSLHNFAGLWAAEQLGVPLVLEYNGSEVWMGDHWGSGLRFRSLAQRIEALNLRYADLVVVVSAASKGELVARGFNADRIVVNPNGVDTDRYSPDIDGTELRTRLGLSGATVIGFIGTFGRWHGADVLVRAFARLHSQTTDFDRLRLLLIGDGANRPQCELLAAELGVTDQVVFAGMVPQLDGPRWLAACDVLVAPHVPNSDGSAFFGSPTKLFEYMAMQRPIVASRLGQIADVLRHGETAWLVEPGQVDALADGLGVVIGDPELRGCMAQKARREVMSQYTWAAHTRRIVERLPQPCN